MSDTPRSDLGLIGSSALIAGLSFADFFPIRPDMWPAVRKGAEQHLILALGNDRTRDRGRTLVMLDREGLRQFVDGANAQRMQELIAPAG